MTGFPSTLFARQKYQILGLGKNGLPAATALHNMGAEVTVWDDHTATPEGFTQYNPTEGLADFTALILSPGIPNTHPAARAAENANIPILSDAEILYQAVRAAGSQARFVGVTGTNGKSTTTSLIAHILQHAGIPVAAGGNLGPAALALPLLPDHGIYVLEMSSYMLERIATLRFDAAIMLNLTPDHLDRHGDMAGYARAKRMIFERQTATDLAVVGIDDEYSREIADTVAPARVVRISEHNPTLTAPALPGSHNAQNIAAALAVADYLGIARNIAAEAVRGFPGLPHRQKLIAEANGVHWIDDSKATNADAAARALACYRRVIWIAGGVAKAGGIESLAPYFPRIGFALLNGRDAELLAATLKRHDVTHRVVETMANAVAAAASLALSEQAPVVLLSPACASFDQYPDFEARGEHFAALARRRIGWIT